MAGIRGTSHPESPELLQRIQNIEAMLGITGHNAGNGPGQPNSQEITGNHKIRDANGILRVVVGQLPSGDYGYYTADPNGKSNEIWPTSSAYYQATLTTASATPVSLANSPTVECYIGASADALVTVAASVQTPRADDPVATLNLAYAIGGGSIQASNSALVLAAGDNTTSVPPLNLNLSASYRLSEYFGAAFGYPNSEIEAGFGVQNTDVTFSLQYSSFTGTCGFSGISIVVLPL